MAAHERNINFLLIYSEQELKIETYEGEFRNLMILINEKIYVEDFGECKGIGRCGTCLVEVEGLNGTATEMERNEKNTLKKVAIKKSNLRLSCQIMINDFLKNTIIRVIEERVDVR